MKKVLIGVLMLTVISFTASAQSSKNTHGKTVSTVAKTNTPGTTNHGKTVSAVAKKDHTTVVYTKKRKPVEVRTHSDNRYKTKTVTHKTRKNY
jgi:uncharacterized protein YxeA